jgi:hypothetical protein
MKRIFFTGAGFSKALNSAYPTLLELTDWVLRGFHSRHSVGPVREHLNQVPAGLTNDLEQLLSYLFVDWPWKASVDKSLDKALYEALVYEIASCLKNIALQPVHDDLVGLVHAISAGGHVTLNYDELPQQIRVANPPRSFWGLGDLRLEVEYPYTSNRKTSAGRPHVLDDLGNGKNCLTFAEEWVLATDRADFVRVVHESGAYDGPVRSFMGDNTPEQEFDFFHMPRTPGEFKPDGRLTDGIHLHGSIYWEGDRNQGQTIRLAAEGGGSTLEKVPILVPPVLDKSHYYSVPRLREQWLAAFELFSRADEIVVVGFSFPATDVSCQYLFKAGTRPGCRIVVVNTDPSVRQRYAAVFAGASVDLDFQYVGADSLIRYTQAEVLNSW